MQVNMSEVSLEEVERSLLEGEPIMATGGFWKPKDCLPRWKVSVDVILSNKCLLVCRPCCEQFK